MLSDLPRCLSASQLSAHEPPGFRIVDHVSARQLIIPLWSPGVNHVLAGEDVVEDVEALLRPRIQGDLSLSMKVRVTKSLSLTRTESLASDKAHQRS
jgi:hypothetical protein